MALTHNLTYNTEKTPIVMTSYGRHVQEMIKHCKQIADRKQRTECAQAIIKVMERQTPEGMRQPKLQQILWNHLYKMAGYDLDIDYPVAVQPEEQKRTPISRHHYVKNRIQYRHYGHLVEELINHAAQMKQRKQRQAMINLTANQMKRSYLTWVRPDVDNNQILQDLHTLSQGRINAKPNDITLKNTKKLLVELQACPASDTPKKKQKQQQKKK